jgi:Tol biopolymer transport system component
MKVLTKPHSAVQDRGVDSILETVNVDSGKRTVLREFDGVIEAPNWTADGKYLVYNRSGRIYRYEIATGTITEIYTGAMTHCNNDHVLAPDGTHIGISNGTTEDGQSRIYIASLLGGEPTLITPIAPSYLHGWSPDGKTLAYCAERNDEFNVYTIPVWGGVEKQLTSAPGLDDGPEYSRDGRIWFNSTRTGLMQLWRMNADGSEQTQMTFDENANSWFGHVSPDGERIAYIAYKKGDVEPDNHPPNKDVQLRLMSAKGGDYKVIAALFGGQGTINVNSWAPDNKTIAFVSYKRRT